MNATTSWHIWKKHRSNPLPTLHWFPANASILRRRCSRWTSSGASSTPSIIDRCLPHRVSVLCSSLQALQQVDKFRGEQQEILSERTATPTSQLKFIVDAWMQVCPWSHCLVGWLVGAVGLG